MSTPTDHRQLVAIVFTDVVGYTQLTEADESRAVAVRERHRTLLRSLVEQFGGELLETPGDESLSVFPSALRAVDCALAIQAALRDDADLRLRIGVHLGDVVRRGDEVIGEGVNVAARIRPLAEPGGVCVSEAIWSQVQSRGHLQATDLGARRMKNVSEPVRVFALRAGAAPRRRRRRGPWIAAGAALALLAAGILLNRASIAAQLFLASAPLLGPSIEQKLAFTTTADGVRIAYATTGAGPPILSVLGWATHLEDGIESPLYDSGSLIPMSSEENLFVRYDGRGFGLSQRDVEDFSVEKRVLDVEAVVAALGVERVSIYAQSSGAPAAIAYAARHPDRVERLALGGGMADRSWDSGITAEVWSGTLDLVATSWDQPAVQQLFTEVVFGRERGPVETRVLREFLRRSGEGPQIAAYMRAGATIEVVEEARRVRAPTLVLHGRDDRVVPIEAGRQIARLIPNADFRVIDGNHAASTGSLPESRQIILDFLRGAANQGTD